MFIRTVAMATRTPQCNDVNKRYSQSDQKNCYTDNHATFSMCMSLHRCSTPLQHSPVTYIIAVNMYIHIGNEYEQQ